MRAYSGGSNIRRIHLFQIDTLNLTGTDQENVSYKDSPEAVAVKWSEAKDPQVKVGGQGPTPAADKPLQASDNVKPDEVSGDRATYNTASDVDLKVNYDDAIQNYELTVPGTVTIHGGSYADVMEVKSYDSQAHTWEIWVYRNGITDPTDPLFKKECFKIRGSKNTQVILDVMDETSLKSVDGSNGQTSPETDPINLERPNPD
jgi:hypothetical protein